MVGFCSMKAMLSGLAGATGDRLAAFLRMAWSRSRCRCSRSCMAAMCIVVNPTEFWGRAAVAVLRNGRGRAQPPHLSELSIGDDLEIPLKFSWLSGDSQLLDLMTIAMVLHSDDWVMLVQKAEALVRGRCKRPNNL